VDGKLLLTNIFRTAVTIENVFDLIDIK